MVKGMVYRKKTKINKRAHDCRLKQPLDVKTDWKNKLTGEWEAGPNKMKLDPESLFFIPP